jgi:hypothetical protein
MEWKGDVPEAGAGVKLYRQSESAGGSWSCQRAESRGFDRSSQGCLGPRTAPERLYVTHGEFLAGYSDTPRYPTDSTGFLESSRG